MLEKKKKKRIARDVLLGLGDFDAIRQDVKTGEK